MRPADRRPTHPEARLLAASAERLGEIFAVDVDEWEVVERTQRPRSTVFQLRAHHSEGSLGVFYKSFAGTDLASDQERPRTERSLITEATLADELHEALSKEGFPSATLLAADPNTLAGAHLRIDGEHLPRRRGPGSPPESFYRRLGRLIRLVEEVGRGLGAPHTVEETRAQLQKRAEAASDALGETRYRSVLETIDRLLTDVDQNTVSTWTHGDVSRTNIVNRAGVPGLIDFRWSPHVTGRDAALFTARFEVERGRRNSIRGPLLEGYGASEGSATAQLRLALVDRALRSMVKRRIRQRSWARRTIDEVAG